MGAAMEKCRKHAAHEDSCPSSYGRPQTTGLPEPVCHSLFGLRRRFTAQTADITAGSAAVCTPA